MPPKDEEKRKIWIQKLSECKKGIKNHFFGKKHSDEAKKKISEKNKNKIGYWLGKKRDIDTINKLRLNKINKKSHITKHTEETKKKISDSKKGSIPWNKNLPPYLQSGWKGGIAYEPYCVQWGDKEYKQSIKDRDGNKCLNPDCSKKQNRIVIHHINYNKKDCRPSNLITLCNSCNAKANSNREWYQSWYNAILYRRIS